MAAHPLRPPLCETRVGNQQGGGEKQSRRTQSAIHYRHRAQKRATSRPGSPTNARARISRASAKKPTRKSSPRQPACNAAPAAGIAASTVSKSRRQRQNKCESWKTRSALSARKQRASANAVAARLGASSATSNAKRRNRRRPALTAKAAIRTAAKRILMRVRAAHAARHPPGQRWRRRTGPAAQSESKEKAMRRDYAHRMAYFESVAYAATRFRKT